MSEYDLVCDACREPFEPAEAVVSWTSEGEIERGFALTHASHVPAGATDRSEVASIVSPNGYLRFVGARLDRRVLDPEALRAILWALAPFVMRPDNAVEMDAMRAASFGAVVGVKPGERPPTVVAPRSPQEDAGK